MRITSLPSEFLKSNRQKLAKDLKSNSVAIFIPNDEMPKSGDQSFRYRPNSDLYYMTGLVQENCIFLFYPDNVNSSQREIIFIQRHDPVAEIWFGHKYSVEEAINVSGITTIKYLDELEKTLHEVFLNADFVYLNQNEYPRYITEVPVKDFRFAKYIKDNFPFVKLERLNPIMQRLRLIKEPIEIENIIKAGEITAAGFNRVLSFVKPGIWEYEIEAEITHEFIRKASTGHAYDPIIASGKNACILHYCTNNNICKNGDLILLDFGAEYSYYASDLSRTIPVNGKFTPRQKEIYEAVASVYKSAIAFYTPGKTLEEVHSEVVGIFEIYMADLGLFTHEQLRNQNPSEPLYKKYYMHGTSHFLGLDVHDPGSRQIKLMDGMVVTNEPGIYIAEEGIGVRIETDIRVGNSPIDLMRSIPFEVSDIESFM